MTSEAGIPGESNVDPSSANGRNAVAIVASLWEKVENLVQLEIKLGLAEAEDKLAALKRELAAKAVGGAIVFAGVLTAIAAVVAALSLALPLWLAALLTALVVIGAGVWLLRRAVALTSPTHRARAASPLAAANNVKETSHGTV